jgi:hypothetical protein
VNEKIIEINWEPQERQLTALNAGGLSEPFDVNLELRPSGSKGELFHKSIADVIFYGGQAGGGKTDTLLAMGFVGCLAYPKLNVGYFRREFPQLEGAGGAIQRSLEILTPVAKYNEQKHRWKYPNGSLLQFCHCKDAKDIYNYQSWQFDILLIDESTQFLVEMIDYLITRNRATVDYPTFRPFTALASNPGNVGHGAHKVRFIKIGEPEKVHPYTYETGQVRTHIFIPSELSDNKILAKRDPEYASRLSTNVMNKRMLLEGDWDVAAGQFFDIWRTSIHTCPPFIPKPELSKVGGIDYGRKDPFAFLGAALQKVRYEDSYFNRLWFYKEIYQTKLSLTDQANKIKESVNLAEYIQMRYDPSMDKEKEDGKKMIADYREIFGDYAYILKPADNDRISGWALLYNWLTLAPDGLPYLIIGENCVNTIRSLPELMHDETYPEDVDDQPGVDDHCGDTLRYIVKHIKWIDARIGGIGHTEKKKILSTAVMKDGRQVALDLDKFATAWKKRR